MKNNYCIVIATAPDDSVAESLAEGILSERLAACIHLHDIRSRYVWEGKLSRDEEIVLWIKTQESQYGRLEAYIQEHHPYDLPEILKVPVTGGLPGYLDWLGESTGGSGSPEETL